MLRIDSNKFGIYFSFHCKEQMSGSNEKLKQLKCPFECIRFGIDITMHQVNAATNKSPG